MKNHLSDLNDHLFAQIERLGDEELNDNDLAREINRSKSITQVSQQIVNNASLVLKAQVARQEYGADTLNLPMVESQK